jgi:hypothetical protein
LVTAAADVGPRTEGLIAGEDIAGLGDRHPPLEQGRLAHEIGLQNDWDQRAYVINEPVGTIVDITLEGENDGGFGISDLFGNVLIFADEGTTGVETGSVTTAVAAPYFVVLFQTTEEPRDFKLTGNVELVPYEDADDGAILTPDQAVTASIDYPFDIDYFVIDLDEGDTINIAVDSLLVDPFLSIAFPGATEEELISDNDSGGGVFGLNPELTYQASHSGRFFIIIVQSSNSSDVGGYTLTVAPAPPGAVPATPPPTPTPTPTPELEPITASAPPAIPMAWYESVGHPFAVQYPANWYGEADENLVTYTDDTTLLGIAEEDLVASGVGEMTLDAYVDLILYTLSQDEGQEFKLLSSQRKGTAQGLPVQILEFVMGPNGIFRASRLIYVDEGKTAFNVTYVTPKLKHQELEPLINYSFSTFNSMIKFFIE